MIKAIELTNWKTHKHTLLEFSKGTNVMIGIMGAGKSSIMDAISYALFGTFPAMAHKRTKINDVITSRPEQQNSGSVRLEFDFDGSSYEVERNVSLKEAAKATLKRNGEYLQSQPQRVTEEIEKILKIDYDLFARAVYSEQNRLDYFLELRSSERKSQIDELLGLNKFATAQENSTSLANRLKESISDKESEMKELDLEKVKKDIETTTGELDLLLKKREGLNSALESAEKLLGAYTDELAIAKKELAKRIESEKRIAEMESKAQLHKKEAEALSKEALPAYAELKEELEKVAKLVADSDVALKDAKKAATLSQTNIARLEELSRQLAKQKDERASLTGKIEGKSIEKANAALEKCKQTIDELTKSMATYDANAAEQRKMLKELETHLGKCPVCERELSEELRTKMISEKKSSIEGYEKKGIEANANLKIKKEELNKENEQVYLIKSTTEMLKKYEGIDGKIETNAKEREKAAAENVSHSKILAEKEENLKQLMEKQSKINANKDKALMLHRHKGEFERISKELEAAHAELKQIATTQKDVDSANSKFAEQKAGTEKLKVEVSAHATYIKDKEAILAEKKSTLERIERISADISSRKKVVEELAKFRNVLHSTQEELRKRLISSINDFMQRIWPEIYPYKDYSSIMLEPSASDYVLMVKTSDAKGSKWEEVDAIASGGERSLACLAMRMAFALVLVPNLKWMILDEPTHNIDENGLGSFIKVVNEVLPQIVDQIFIITHDEALKHGSSSKTYMFSRNKGDAGSTVITADE